MSDIKGRIGQQNNSIIDIRISTQFNLIWFDKREITKGLKAGGKAVQKESRRLIANRAVSSPDDYPGYDSGAMSKAIAVRASSLGWYVTVMPYRTAAMGDDYYPAYLYYGTSNIARRADFMEGALLTKRHAINRHIHLALLKALRKAPTIK